MDMGIHDLTSLFGQLGLANDERSIAQFIETHQLMRGISIDDAPFWNAAQKEMLQQAIADDAEWAGAADLFAALLTSAK